MWWILVEDGRQPGVLLKVVETEDEASAKQVFEALSKGGAYEAVYLTKVEEAST